MHVWPPRPASVLRRRAAGPARFAGLVLALVVGAVSVAGAQTAAAPQVTKVEPPNWWPGHSIDPVRVLVRGRNLSGARVEPVGDGLTVGLIRINAAGTYLFADVRIHPGAAPGPRRLRITTAAGTAEAPFDISAPLPRENRFRGVSPDDVIYLLMPDRFRDGDPSNNDPEVSRGLFDRSRPRYYHGGDFRGVIQKLPYLKDLGVTVLWLNPWYDNVNHLNDKERYDGTPITDYHGYGAVDFYGVEEHFGTMAELVELVDAARALGLKVMQDQVANHSGPYHPWVGDMPTPTWFNGTERDHRANTWQTWTLQDPSATAALQRATLEGWFIDILPDFNQHDEEAARYIIQNSLWWVGTLGLDGIRQDTWPYVPRVFWQRWMEALKREYPDLFAVGELYDGDPALVSFFAGGAARFDGVDTKVDSLFDFPLFFTIRRAFAESKPVSEIAQMLARDHLYPAAERLVVFLGNHDMLRFMQEPGATAAGLKLAQTFIMTTRGIPQIYYGDEIAIAGGPDPDNRRSMPGAFDGDARDAFTSAGRTPDEQDVFEHLRRVIAIRHELEPLRRGTLQQLYVADQQYSYARTTPSTSVVVAINNDPKPATWTVDLSATRVRGDALLEDRLGVIAPVKVEGGRMTVTLPPRTASILAQRDRPQAAGCRPRAASGFGLQP